MNYYPFHIGDYLSATRHLSWEEDAAYRRLLDTYYTTEKPLPADLRAVCRLVLAQTDAQREAVRVVLEEFFQPTDAGWVNGRADAEIQTMREKQQKQRDKANKRWAKPAQEPGIASAMPRHEIADAAASISDAGAMPPTPTPTPTPKKEKRAPRADAPKPVPVSVLIDAGIDEQTATEFIAHKAGLKAPLTARAWSDHLSEASKAGWTPKQAAEKVMAKGWKGFEAKYVASEVAPAGQAPPMSFRERDAELAKEVGRRWMGSCAPGSTDSNVIDMEEINARISMG